jgi:hypothetical protein
MPILWPNHRFVSDRDKPRAARPTIEVPRLRDAPLSPARTGGASRCRSIHDGKTRMDTTTAVERRRQHRKQPNGLNAPRAASDSRAKRGALLVRRYSSWCVPRSLPHGPVSRGERHGGQGVGAGDSIHAQRTRPPSSVDQRRPRRLPHRPRRRNRIRDQHRHRRTGSRHLRSSAARRYRNRTCIGTTPKVTGPMGERLDNAQPADAARTAIRRISECSSQTINNSPTSCAQRSKTASMSPEWNCRPNEH